MDPPRNQQLFVKRETNNRFDSYAIAAVKHLSQGGRRETRVVGHLPPKEVSRLVSFILAHGAEVLIKVTDRRSPLIQGGLEIPSKDEPLREKPIETCKIRRASKQVLQRTC